MKKILFFLLATVVMTGCTQNPKANNTVSEVPKTDSEFSINTDWLSTALTKNLAEHNFILKEIDSQEIGYPATKALGFNDSGISVLVFDRNHEVYGNEKEFEEAITRYSTDKYYGENILKEKQIHPGVILKYTKSSVMANHGAMQKEYFFTMPHKEILKVKVTFPADPEIDNNSQKELTHNKVNEIEKILLSDL